MCQGVRLVVEVASSAVKRLGKHRSQIKQLIRMPSKDLVRLLQQLPVQLFLGEQPTPAWNGRIFTIETCMLDAQRSAWHTQIRYPIRLIRKFALGLINVAQARKEEFEVVYLIFFVDEQSSLFTTSRQRGDPRSPLVGMHHSLLLLPTEPFLGHAFGGFAS